VESGVESTRERALACMLVVCEAALHSANVRVVVQIWCPTARPLVRLLLVSYTDSYQRAFAYLVRAVARCPTTLVDSVLLINVALTYAWNPIPTLQVMNSS
jgi:hypothetical protein